MKRIFIALSVLCVPLLVFSENKIKMVTYFPVPYVAYSKINASKQLDIGLTSACEMNLGCSESGALGIRPLQATTVNLNRGKLDLNTAAAVKSTNVTLGSGSGEVNIDFATNLRIGTLNNGYSLEAADMTVDELKLFASHMRAGGEKFPSCAATGASGAPQVSWQKVKLTKAEEVYLVCGTPKVSGCDASSKPSTPSPRTCNTCGTQSATVSCNESTGQWQTVWGSCSVSSSSQCATYSWQYEGWTVLRSFLCGQNEEAESFCRTYPDTPTPSGSCDTEGETQIVGCSVNDYCPGHPIDIEALIYVCK